MFTARYELNFSVKFNLKIRKINCKFVLIRTVLDYFCLQSFVYMASIVLKYLKRRRSPITLSANKSTRKSRLLIRYGKHFTGCKSKYYNPPHIISRLAFRNL